jgi:trigger factor
MKIQIQKLPKSQIEIFFEVPAEVFKDYFEKAIFNLGRDFKIEGFRKGKVPREILERELDTGKILEEAANLAVRENYVRVILENKIEAIGRPEIQITKIAKGSPLEFKAKVFVLPEVNLPDYKAIASKIQSREVLVEENEIEEAINFLQKSRAKFLSKTEGCKNGDFVEISFQSPQIERGKEKKDSFILGQGKFVSGFEENLEGMKSGTEKNFSINFPENHFQKNLAGKTIDFKVKMISVSKIELPEITDSWARSLGNFQDLESLKKSIQEGIKMEKIEEEKQRKRQEILEKIQENTFLEIPDILIDFEKERMIEELKENLQNQFQINFNDYLTKIKKTEEELKESFSLEAKKRVTSFLILREIAKREKILVSEKEIRDKINEMLKDYPSIEKAEKELDLEKLKIYYEGVIRNEKVFQFLEKL